MISIRFRKSNLKPSELGTLARNLAVIIAEKQPLPRSLESLSKQAVPEKIGKVLSRITAEIRKGNTLAAAILKQEHSIGSFFCQTVVCSESAGTLGNLLVQLAEYYGKDDSFQKKISRLLKYPALIAAGTIGIFSALLAFMIPAAVRKITMTGSDPLPAATKIALVAITFIAAHWQVLLLLVIISFLFFMCLLRSDAQPHWLERIIWNLPHVNNFSKKKSLRRFSHALYFLLSGGLSPVQALTIATETIKNDVLRDKLIFAARKDAVKNFSLADCFKRADIYPPVIIDMLLDTQKQQNGFQLFKKIADFYEEEIEAATNAFVVIIEPVIVIIMGLLGGGILLALYLPVLRAIGNH